jgi:hypothetical protein
MGYDFHQKTRTVEDISVRFQLRVCECRRKLCLRGHTGAEAAVARAFPYEAIQLEHMVNAHIGRPHRQFLVVEVPHTLVEMRCDKCSG